MKTKQNQPAPATPTSVSLSTEALGLVDDWAYVRGLSRTAAISEMIDRYLVIVAAPAPSPGMSSRIRKLLVAWLATAKWRARDLLTLDIMARRALGEKIGDQVLMQPTGVLAALLDESERGS